MSERDAVWKGFEVGGPEEVRKRISTGDYSGTTAALAREWLNHSESRAASADRRKAIDAAVEANEFARKANELASRTAEAARTNNMIATIALIAAVIAIAVSIIGIFVRH